MPHVYMHKTSFDISRNRGESITFTINGEERKFFVADQFFEVDELIALPLQKLNRKGYYTACSCQGHPFDHVLFHLSPEGALQPVVAEFPCPHESYVTFMEPYELPSLPEGFTMQKTEKSLRIFKVHPKNGDYEETLSSIIAAMNALSRWADELPPRI